MNILYSKVDQGRGLLLTVSGVDEHTGPYRCRVGCAITGNYLRGLEGVIVYDDAVKWVNETSRTLCSD